MPAVISQRKDEFESSPFIWLHSILRLANEKNDRKSLEAVCGTFLQLTGIEIDPEEVHKQSQTTNLGYLQHWIKFVRQKNLNPDTKKVLNNVLEYLVKSRNFQTFSSLAIEWFEKLVQDIQERNNGYGVEIFVRYEEERTTWEELMREITASSGSEITLETFLQELQMHSKESYSREETVSLMTIHSAKGKEFDHVYLIGLVEDELPSFQSIQKGNKSLEMEEERRNCFVAITRAIKTLTLSYADRYRGWSKKPSRFLMEMGLL